MPELPEVETTRRGIEPHLNQQAVKQVIVRNARLRWPLPSTLRRQLPGQTITQVTRRGKYLLLNCTRGTLLIHLGMSGSLRILPKTMPANKHDHVDIILANDLCLRFTDPRRFGCVLWIRNDPFTHDLLKNLGPEPLSTAFTGHYLYQQAGKRKIPVKSFIMNGQVVVGVGNIYANEALFLAAINPLESAGRITKERYLKLVNAIKKILKAAIKQGGTTLRDFTGSNGQPGYFKQRLQVYGRAGLPCNNCAMELKETRLGQRSTVYCPHCQT